MTGVQTCALPISAILADEISLIRQVLSEHADWLETPQLRHCLILELIRQLALLDFQSILASSGWRTYLAMHATFSGLSDGELRDQVAKVAGALVDLGVEKGDRVVVYMPMVPEAVMAMLAMPMAGSDHGCSSAAPNGLATVRWVAMSGLESAVMTRPRMVALSKVARVS